MVYLLQAKPSQAKPNTPNYTFSFTVLATHKTPFLAKVPGKAFFNRVMHQDTRVFLCDVVSSRRKSRPIIQIVVNP